MWLKLLGASLVLASTSAIGNLVAKNFLARPRQLRQLRHALQVLETEISYSLSFLPQALQKVAQAVEPPVAFLFSQTSQLLLDQEGHTAGEAWKLTLNKYLPQLSLKTCDEEILWQLASSLGCSDRDNQLKHLKLAQEYLQKEEEKAAIEGEKNAPLWRYCGLFLGMTIIILLY